MSKKIIGITVGTTMNPKRFTEQFKTDETLTLENGVLRVNTTNVVEANNMKPITSAAVHTTVGNIEVLLKTI